MTFLLKKKKNVLEIITKEKRDYFSKKIEDGKNSKTLFTITDELFVSKKTKPLPSNYPRDKLP